MTRAAAAGAAVLVAAVLAAPTSARGDDAVAAGRPALAGGASTATGMFITYSDEDTVIEGGTVVPPDGAVPLAEAEVDLTGQGRALAALGYTPYAEGAGLVNAFGGTELPLGRVSDPARAKVTGHPTQEAEAPMPGERSAGRARARIDEGPRAEASAVTADSAPTSGATVRAGAVDTVVDTTGGVGDVTATVVLRDVRVGDALRFETVVLSVRAAADGAAGAASATTTVEGVTLAGRSARLTPDGVVPDNPVGDGGGKGAGSGVEVVAAGTAAATPGARESEATATGPRLRFTALDGRVVEVVLGQASASSTYVPPDAGRTPDRPAPGGAPAAPPDPVAAAGRIPTPSSPTRR